MAKILVVGCEAIGGGPDNDNGNVLNIGFIACTGIMTRREMGVVKENGTVEVSDFCKKYTSCRQSLMANWMRGEVVVKCPLLRKK